MQITEPAVRDEEAMADIGRAISSGWCSIFDFPSLVPAHILSPKPRREEAGRKVEQQIGFVRFRHPALTGRHSSCGRVTQNWPILNHAQHGQAYRQLYDFKNKFPAVLALAMAVYLDANAEVTEESIILKPSRPPVAPHLVGSR